MDRIGKPVRLLHLLLLIWAVVPVAIASEQNKFAVVQLANATDDVTIKYRFHWGAAGEQYSIKAQQHSHHYYRYDLENQNGYPIPEIRFVTTIDRERSQQVYTLRALASPSQDRGGQWYVFEKRIDARGEEYIDLVSVRTFLTHNSELVAKLLAGNECTQAINRCDIALRIDATDAPTVNFRGRANYLLQNFDRAIDDFTTAIGLDPKQAIYHNNRGHSYIGVNQYAKALADFEAAIQIDPKLANPHRGRELARAQLTQAQAVEAGPGKERPAPAVRVRETRLDTAERTTQLRALPKEFAPYITAEAYRALETFRLGSKVDADENARLQVAYDRAYEEGRYVDAQEANYIRAIEREPVAALWKMIAEPAGNDYYLPKFTPVEERLSGLKRPLVGKDSDKMVYVKSDDDLAGLRIAIRRWPRDPGDGGLETAAIIPVRWVKGSGVVPLDPPDNLRVLIQLKKNGEHAMLGMSFSLTTVADGTWDLRPEIYTSPKFGEDRFKGASSTVVSPRGCMDCHALGFNTKASKFAGPASEGDGQFAAALKQMPGIDGFLADARKRGATAQDVTEAESMVARPDLNVLTRRSLRIAVIKLWNAIYYANQPYLDDADGRFVEYHDRYGSAWLEAGDLDKALDHFNKAVGRGPEVAQLYFKRGWVNLRKQRLEKAVDDLDQSVRLQPGSMAAHNLRARLLATAPVQSLRNGAEAVRAATRACELAGWKSPEYLDTLAAAYAEAGDFRQAVQWQEKALADPGLARALGEGDTKAARNRLELYRQNRPFRDPSSSPQ